MSKDGHHLHRRNPTEGKYFIDRGYIILVTVCTLHRKPWLANPKVHSLLHDTWRQSTVGIVGRYVILPDHVHFFASPGDGAMEIDSWNKYWKSRFAMKYLEPTCKWQSRSWNSRLRTGESYNAKWDYVRNNPVRHGLVKHAEDWPFCGEISELFWE